MPLGTTYANYTRPSAAKRGGDAAVGRTSLASLYQLGQQPQQGQAVSAAGGQNNLSALYGLGGQQAAAAYPARVQTSGGQSYIPGGGSPLTATYPGGVTVASPMGAGGSPATVAGLMASGQHFTGPELLQYGGSMPDAVNNPMGWWQWFNQTASQLNYNQVHELPLNTPYPGGFGH